MNARITKEIQEAIQAEQDAGRAKYGKSADNLAHDDATPESAWHEYISDHNERAKESTPMERRQHLLKVAGLAISAIEAFDRKRISYVEAIGRNPGEENQHSHLYEITIRIGDDGKEYDHYLPMCRKGWNRSDGEAFSIFRGHSGKRGTCAVCQKRKDHGLPGVEAVPGSHKTKWL